MVTAEGIRGAAGEADEAHVSGCQLECWRASEGVLVCAISPAIWGWLRSPRRSWPSSPSRETRESLRPCSRAQVLCRVASCFAPKDAVRPVQAAGTRGQRPAASGDWRADSEDRRQAQVGGRACIGPACMFTPKATEVIRLWTSFPRRIARPERAARNTVAPRIAQLQVCVCHPPASPSTEGQRLL